LKQVDTRADRYADSEWHSGWIERDTKPLREPTRSYFDGAVLLLWVVAFIALSAIWRYFA